MAEFDHGFKMIAETTGRQLARLAGVESSAWKPAERTVQAPVEIATSLRAGDENVRRLFLVLHDLDSAAP